MSVLEEMLTIRDKLESQDRQEAMIALVWLLSYEVPFRIGSNDTFTLFRNENDINTFCVNHEVKIPVMKRLLDSMRAEGLIASEALPVIITPLGVEKLCQR